MDRYDLQLPVLTTEQEIEAPGSIPLVRGEASLRQWMLRAMITAPGELYHRPDFGVGASDVVDTSTRVAAAQIANRARAVIRRDRRVQAVRVYANPDPDNPERIIVEAEVRTVDNTTVNASTVIAIGA